MEFTSYSKKEQVLSVFMQIEKAIEQLQEWNSNIHSANDYYLSPGGMQTLAASCMLIEAIGEGVNKIDRITEKQLLSKRDDIPWEDIIGLRNHIAHGYFDIDGDIVFSVVKEDLLSLLEAVRFFINELA
ncbi:MAG: DUF86 domain-containing protein [Bacteroidaceae bacterium]|nr:DUF86 domain-containing protein [Bacteroidaceae bacterium]